MIGFLRLDINFGGEGRDLMGLSSSILLTIKFVKKRKD